MLMGGYFDLYILNNLYGLKVPYSFYYRRVIDITETYRYYIGWITVEHGAGNKWKINS